VQSACSEVAGMSCDAIHEEIGHSFVCSSIAHPSIHSLIQERLSCLLFVCCIQAYRGPINHLYSTYETKPARQPSTHDIELTPVRET